MSEPGTVPPLRTRLDARVSQLDVAYRASMDAAITHLRRSGVAARAKRAGDRAPDFALRDPDGAMVSLSEQLRLGPVVLSFLRGEWCSFCRIEIEALIEALPDLVAAGASLVMVSPQGPSETLIDVSRAVPGLTVLRDPLNGVGLQYGLIFRLPDSLRAALLALDIDVSHLYGTDAWLLPIPATYLIRPDGAIALAHSDPDFTRRLEPGDLIASLCAQANLAGRGQAAPGDSGCRAGPAPFACPTSAASVGE